VKKLALACAVVAALGGAAYWWAAQSAAPPGAAANATRTGDERQAAGGFESPPASGNGTALAHSGVRAGEDPFLSADLRFLLEGLLLEAGDAGSPAELKRRLAALVPRHFPAAHAVRALALAERYVDYRVALGSIKPPADPRDPQAVRLAMEARQKVRERYFSGEEFEALFGQDLALDRFTVARLEIERNEQLTPAQKQAALRQAESEFTPAQREQRALAQAHVVVAGETARFDADGIADAERYAQRRQQHGEAAAQRLAHLDQEERQWQARLGQYAGALGQGLPPAELAQLRGRRFTEAEQLRLEGALAARAQPSTYPR
jgi:lipase chaperone LimK